MHAMWKERERKGWRVVAGLSETAEKKSVTCVTQELSKERPIGVGETKI